ncbi:hypothetical protein JRC04_12700 [Mycolicibacterium sp. S2-37]|uniref:hypothetical protein n=1 Tax=Mycolicibacterium sp. S2-37 TaxID=2810297 RepID=UPI001A946419|nr:hypothetical protein [Mycolicibacterium sp. S2-37]MBO0678323.1 hypothetical protein [Mycolicibacterium sp. S2-37]
MDTNEVPEATVRINFEHWLHEAIRTGVRGAHLQPLTLLTPQTWEAIDAVADAVSASGGRLQAVVLSARRALERQLDQTHPVAHTSHVSAA